MNIIEENLNKVFVKNIFDEDLNNFIKTIKYKKVYCDMVFKIMLNTPSHFIDSLPYSYNLYILQSPSPKVLLAYLLPL